MRHELPKPTNAELEILTVLWCIGPATMREVYEAISRRRPAQYSTTLKFMQIMANKGLLRRDEKQRGHVYEAVKTRAWRKGSWPAICSSAPSADRPRPSWLARFPPEKPRKKSWRNC